MIDRDFVTIAEGPVHMRRLRGPGRPLLLLHPSPNSSRGMVPVMQALRAAGSDADLIAIDTLGNGDSPPPAPDVPDIAYFADAVRRIIATMGLAQVDLYGAHRRAHRLRTGRHLSRSGRPGDLPGDQRFDPPPAPNDWTPMPLRWRPTIMAATSSGRSTSCATSRSTPPISCVIQNTA
ncbi:MAG: alpha/beta hydrolase [Sphingobium sp.]|nr:alpha/beta hydrolase [Sphingobium sp.]